MALIFEPAYSRADHHTRPVEITEQFVVNVLNHMLDDIYNNPEHVTIIDVIEKAEYTADMLRLWVKKYSDSVKISLLYKKIRETLENRLNKNGLTGDNNTTMVKMNLTNHYGWTDKQEVINKNADISINEKDLQSKTPAEISQYYKQILGDTTNSE